MHSSPSIVAHGDKALRLFVSHSSDVKAGHMLLHARTCVPVNGYETLAIVPVSRCFRKRPKLNPLMIKMLQHWRCRQWAGQPGISRCSTVGAEREAMAHYCSPVFKLRRIAANSIPLDESRLQQVIRDSAATARGPDGVTYAMVEAAGSWAIRLLLSIYSVPSALFSMVLRYPQVGQNRT
eukprot:2490848-Amphidinium_carterae.3